MSSYRGTPIDSVEYNRKADLYTLVNSDGQIVAKLKRHEYLSQPQLRTVKVTNGRYRRSRAAFRGSSAGQPYFTIPAGAFVSWTAGGITWFGADYAKPKPIEDAGIRAGEVMARRCWRIIGDRLHSTYRREHQWVPGVPMTGDVRHEYGVHAFKEESSIQECIHENRLYDASYVLLTESGWAKQITTPFAVGTIALWGDIVEHERGYRAEFAKIATIERVEGSQDPELLDRLRAVYGIPAVVGTPSELGNG